jgi:hypothetical protein
MLIRTIGHSCQSGAFGSEPLGEERCKNLATAIADLRPGRSVELYDDEPGKAAVIILPDAPDDAVLFPFLAIGSRDSSFWLEELCGTACRTLGEYWEWEEVVRAVRLRMLFEMPISMMVH